MRSWLVGALVVIAGCSGSSTRTDTPATTTTTATATATTTTTKPFRCPDGSKPVPLPPPTNEKFAYECESVTPAGPQVSSKP